MALTELSQNSLEGEAVNESKIQISNAGTNGQYLQKQSGDAGGLTWADATSTTINNNADNRVITGSGTANTLNGESNVVIDSSGRLMIGTTTEGHTSGDDLTIATTGGPTGITLRSDTDEGGRIFFSDGTSGADEYRGVVGYDHGSNYLYLSTDATERVRIDSSGRFLVGAAASRTVWGGNAQFQVEGTSGETSSIAITRNTADQWYPYLTFGKSRGTSDGSSTILQSGDITGLISFNGADGGDMNPQTAYIQSAVDGTPGVNDMPGRLQFFTTADGAYDSTERLRIDKDGNVGIGTSPSYLTHIKKDTSGGAVGTKVVIENAATDTVNNKVELYLKTSAGEFGLQHYNATESYIQTPDQLVVNVNTANSALTAARIDTSGKVSIGTNVADHMLSVVAANSATPRIGIANPDNSENFNISTYHDSNGIYTVLGSNAKLDSSGNGAVDDANHKAAAVEIDARNHGSVSLQTASAGSTVTTRFKVDANGYVTKPYNVSFRADNLGDTTGSYSHSAGDCIWYTEDWDVGGCYDTSNGRFTAPVDGKYFFTVSMIYADDTQHSIWFRKNGGTILQFHFATQSSSEWNGRNYTGIMNLAQNDYVTLYHSSAALHGGGYSQFQGFLIG